MQHRFGAYKRAQSSLILRIPTVSSALSGEAHQLGLIVTAIFIEPSKTKAFYLLRVRDDC